MNAGEAAPVAATANEPVEGNEAAEAEAAVDQIEEMAGRRRESITVKPIYRCLEAIGVPPRIAKAIAIVFGAAVVLSGVAVGAYQAYLNTHPRA